MQIFTEHLLHSKTVREREIYFSIANSPTGTTRYSAPSLRPSPTAPWLQKLLLSARSLLEDPARCAAGRGRCADCPLPSICLPVTEHVLTAQAPGMVGDGRMACWEPPTEPFSLQPTTGFLFILRAGRRRAVWGGTAQQVEEGDGRKGRRSIR